MRRIWILGCCGIVLLSLALTANAEQQVTLRNGTTMVGNVSNEGADLVVDVDGAKLKVPFADVQSVASLKSGDGNQAQRLLYRALEAQLLSDGENKELGLLAEAYQLAPDDPRIAFWYARGLADAGFGNGAAEVFDPHDVTIAAAYPGAADRLERAIQQRMAYEKLPPKLLKRLDQIAAAAKLKSPLPAEKSSCSAYFRLVDQADKPIERSAFRINCHGEDENLESFDDGYYLFTYMRRNHFGNNPCTLDVSQPGLATETFRFDGSVLEAEDLGVLRVQRMTDADRRPVVVKVVDAEGKPLSGAKVVFTPISSQGGRDGEPPVATNAEGEAKVKLYPNRYSSQINLKEYYPASQTIELPSGGAEPTNIDAKLHLAISATIKVAWRAKLGGHPGMPQFQNDAVTTGDFEQIAGPREAGGPPAGGGPFGPAWVRLVQEGDEMKLQFQDQMHFAPGAGPPSWVARLGRSKEQAEDAAKNLDADRELFELLDLKDLDLLESEVKLERTSLGGMPGRMQPVSVPLERGDIYVGRINGRDMHTGRPAVIEFKILASELFRP